MFLWLELIRSENNDVISKKLLFGLIIYNLSLKKKTKITKVPRMSCHGRRPIAESDPQTLRKSLTVRQVTEEEEAAFLN